MAKNKVRVGKVYEYNKNGFDWLDSKTPVITNGTKIRVVNLAGCPPANTMGQCYVQDLSGKFIGMIDTASCCKIA